ncbi:MAG: tetratricopeptide repeat protein, partial [Flavobacterium sp.]
MKNLWLALVFLCPVLVWPQSSKHIDSLLVMLSRSSEDSTKVNLLNDLSAAYTKLDHVKAMSFARRALTTAEKIEWQEGISRSYFRIATQYGDSFDSKKSLFYFQKALAATSDKRQMSKIYTDAGNIKMFESHYSQALAYYHRALEIDESLGDKSGIAKLTLNIASVYYSIRDYPKSIAFFNKSLEQKTGDQNYKATILRNLGAAYSGMGKQQKALNYFSRSLAILEKIGNMSGKSSLLSDMALTYYDMADYAKAIRYSRLSLDAAPDGAEDKVNKAFTYGIIGDSYTEKAALNKSSKVLLDSAGYYLNKSIDMHRQLNS